MAKRNGGKVYDFGPVDQQMNDYWLSLSYVSHSSIGKVVDLPDSEQVRVMILNV